MLEDTAIIENWNLSKNNLDCVQAVHSFPRYQTHDFVWTLGLFWQTPLCFANADVHL